MLLCDAPEGAHTEYSTSRAPPQHEFRMRMDVYNAADK